MGKISLAALMAAFLLMGACNSGKSPEEEASTGAAAENAVKDEPVYENARFREVRVQRVGIDSFYLTGKAQVFEATLSWVIEDGHNELDSGYHTASAGGPEWGDFAFGVKAVKDRPNSTLSLILFESSARDGSRQHELIIPLY